MTDQIGAPGHGMSRREFVAATGSAGLFAAAGCTTTTQSSAEEVETGSPASTTAPSLPETGRPEVVDATGAATR